MIMAATHFSGPVVSPGGFIGPITGAITGITALTDNSGGTANNTIEAVPAATAADTDTSAASLASTNTALTAIKNDIADLTAKLNAVIAALD
jgi:hypothetical protein